MRWLVRVVLLLAVLYGGFLAIVYSKMTQPPLEFAAFWADVPGWARSVVPFQKLWAVARAGDLQIGDEAPDFELEYHDHSGKMRLSDLRGRPVVLAFGSYT
ncbi:MAG: hypothetical protein R2748_07935 [Bryobacterales bacterium]